MFSWQIYENFHNRYFAKYMRATACDWIRGYQIGLPTSPCLLRITVCSINRSPTSWPYTTLSCKIWLNKIVNGLLFLIIVINNLILEYLNQHLKFFVIEILKMRWSTGVCNPTPSPRPPHPHSSIFYNLDRKTVHILSVTSLFFNFRT